MMKKLFLCLLALCLVGCASEKETKTGYCKGSVKDPNGYEVEHDYQFEYQGDQVTKQTITLSTTFTNDIYFENGVLSDTAKSLLKQGVQQIENTLKDAKGIVYRYEISDNKIVESYEVDYSKATNDELIAIGLLSQGDAESSFVSMKKTIENLEDSQFTCTSN